MCNNRVCRVSKGRVSTETFEWHEKKFSPQSRASLSCCHHAKPYEINKQTSHTPRARSPNVVVFVSHFPILRNDFVPRVKYTYTRRLAGIEPFDDVLVAGRCLQQKMNDNQNIVNVATLSFLIGRFLHISSAMPHDHHVTDWRLFVGIIPTMFVDVGRPGWWSP